MSSSSDSRRTRVFRCGVNGCRSTAFEQVERARIYTPVAISRVSGGHSISVQSLSRVTTNPAASVVRCVACHAAVATRPLPDLVPVQLDLQGAES